MKEKEAFSDSGPKHAVLITLFNGRRFGRVVTNEELKAAIAEEYGDNSLVVSDFIVFKTVIELGEDFKKHAPEYSIQSRENIGYDLLKISAINNNS